MQFLLVASKSLELSILKLYKETTIVLLSINSGARVVALLQSLKKIYCASVFNIAGIRQSVLEGYCKIQFDGLFLGWFCLV